MKHEEQARMSAISTGNSIQKTVRVKYNENK